MSAVLCFLILESIFTEGDSLRVLHRGGFGVRMETTTKRDGD